MDLNPRHGHAYPGHGYSAARPDPAFPDNGYPDDTGYPDGGGRPGGDYQGDDLPTESYQTESFRSEGHPAREYPADRFAESGYPENGYPDGEYQGDPAYRSAAYPEGRFRGSEYPDDSYSEDAYPERGYSDSGFPEGGYPRGGYAADSDPATIRLGHNPVPFSDGGDGRDEDVMRCPVCVAANYPDARYCEACGFAFSGAPVDGGDEDHREIDLGTLAGVCDRGVRHTTNEDSMGVAVVHGTLIAVVCDGVSTTPGSGDASAAAAATATALLADAVRAHGPGEAVPYEERRESRANEVLDVLEEYSDYDEPRTAPRRISGGFGPDEAEAALHSAVEAAQATIAQLSAAEGRMAPSCTFAAAIITPPSVDGPGMVTVGWVGDSRVYLLGPRWCERLTADDTWAAEAARAGLIPASEAETHRRAHTLTRWLGGDAEDVAPHTAAFPIETPATVVVCSDGLWNYSSRPDVLAALVNQLEPDARALDVARHLTEFAIDQGGHDNITVVAARVTG